MKAHEFIRETFDLDNRISISELPDLPISLVVEMLNNYKEGKVKKLNESTVKSSKKCLGCGKKKNLLPGGYCEQCDWENANDIFSEA